MSVDIEASATTTRAYTGTDADFIDVLIAHFTAIPTYWTIEFSSAGSGIVLHKAGGKTFQIFVRVDGSNIKIRVDPGLAGVGAITDAAGTNISANASPDTVIFIQATSLFDNLIINEFTDYLQVWQRSNSVVPPTLVEGFDAGIGISPAYGSDPGNDFDGLVCGVGDPNMGGAGANTFYTSSTTSKTLARTGTSTWEAVEFQEGTTPGAGDIDSQDVGTRTEPIPVIVELNIAAATTGRPIGTHKYFYGVGGSARQPCVVIDDATNSKQIMTIGNSTGASFRICTGIKDGFDPTAVAT